MVRELNDFEINLVDSISHIIRSDQPSFAVSGFIESDALNISELGLYITEGGETGQDSTSVMLTFPLDDNSAARIFKAGTPSPHGKGDETVFDPSYRLAHELKPPNFALSADLISSSGVLNTLPLKICTTSGIRATLHKLNAYGVGGFFKPHRDTPRGESHIGTLTFCLPSSFTGGELLIRQDDHMVNIDWSTQVLSPAGSKIAWTFLYADCEHEVRPVKSGTRITLTYDVFLCHSDTEGIFDSRGEPLKEMLVKNVLDNTSTFLPEGGTLAFSLRHSYAVEREGRGGFAHQLDKRLKGVDEVLLKAIQDLALEWKFQAVYDLRNERADRGEDSDGSYFDEEEDGRLRPKLLLSENYHLIRGQEVNIESELLWDALSSAGAIWRRDVVWVNTPEIYDIKTNYIAYGNEAETAYIYSAAAILVEIPPVKERSIPNKRKRVD